MNSRLLPSAATGGGACLFVCVWYGRPLLSFSALRQGLAVQVHPMFTTPGARTWSMSRIVNAYSKNVYAQFMRCISCVAHVLRSGGCLSGWLSKALLRNARRNSEAIPEARPRDATGTPSACPPSACPLPPGLDSEY